MPIYRVFTPLSDVSMFTEDAQTYLKNITNHSILFSTEIPEDDPEDDLQHFSEDGFIGYRIPFLNDTIDNTEWEDGATYNTFVFKKSNIKLEMQNDSDEYSPTLDLHVNELQLIHDNIYSPGGTETYDEILKELKAFIKVIKSKEMGRNLLGVARVGEKRKLPENMEGRIAEFLTAKRGHIVSQMNQLQQNAGIQLAPRVRAAMPKQRQLGGKRRTQKKKRNT